MPLCACPFALHMCGHLAPGAQPFPGTFPSSTSQHQTHAASSSPTSHVNTSYCPSSRPLTLSPFLPDYAKSTSEPPLPTPFSVHCCQALIFTSGLEVRGTNNCLPGKCRQQCGAPALAFVMHGFSVMRTRVRSELVETVSLSHAFMSSPAAAERALGGGAGVIHSAFLHAFQRAAWEIEWGCHSQLSSLPLRSSEVAQSSCRGLYFLFTFVQASYKASSPSFTPTLVCCWITLSHVSFLGSMLFPLWGSEQDI